MVTLKDLAATVGVSTSAVSLVLNDRHRGRVNEGTAERVRRAAAEMGYVPNVIARGLRTKRTHTLGLLSDRVASVPFAGRMLEGVQTAAWDEGYLAMVVDTASRPEMTSQATKSLLQRDIEALILAADYHRVVEIPQTPPTIPTVILDGVPRDAVGADSVVPDEATGAERAVAHLLAAGHRRIGFCNVDGFIASSLRRDGYERALRGAGIDVDPALVLALPDPSTTGAIGPLRALMSSSVRPTALFCFSDQIAFAAYQVCVDLGIRVPEDLSVVGFDDQRFIADALRPGLTSVRLPHFEMGEWAGKRAIERIRGVVDGDAKAERMPCPLIERGSVGPPR